VYFLDGERLEGLNEWAFLQTDAAARARLTGLRSALRYNIRILEEIYVKGEGRHVEPLFVHGIEAYLSEPMNGSDDLLTHLLDLLRGFKLMEGLREAYSAPTKVVSNARQQVWPSLVRLAEHSVPIATHCLTIVNTTLEKLKPLY
jgi:hypothetical protein